MFLGKVSAHKKLLKWLNQLLCPLRWLVTYKQAVAVRIAQYSNKQKTNEWKISSKRKSFMHKHYYHSQLCWHESRLRRQWWVFDKFALAKKLLFALMKASVSPSNFESIVLIPFLWKSSANAITCACLVNINVHKMK